MSGIIAREFLTNPGLVEVYVDSDEFPIAILPKGKYKVEGGEIIVTFSLFRDDKKVGQAIVVNCQRKNLTNLQTLF